MNRMLRTGLVVASASILFILVMIVFADLYLRTSALPVSGKASPAQKKLRVLYVTQSKGFKHGVLPESEKIMQELGAKNGFEVTVTQEAEKAITPESLKNLDVIIFYTTGELPLSAEQKKAFLDFIRSGKGFIGIHSATDTFYQWPEYGEMIGAYFDGHPWTSKDTVTVRKDDKTFPATKQWEDSFQLTEEIYQYKQFNPANCKVVMSMDTGKTDMTKQGIKASSFPLVWHRQYGRGRVFYSEFGHNPEVWRDSRYQTMIANAIKWVSGQLK
ncbi:MAG TPA: ThuA domain-containing protein [Blastocatellia bacterium]|nr:ThuA domain-containing protein [Blastocatellia bacterium]